MSARQIIVYITSFLLFIGSQVLFVRTLVFFDLAFCFVYTTFILLLPISTPRLLYMFIAFFTGFFVDMFYDTLGIHAAACVLMAYTRQFVFRALTPAGGYDDNQEININNLGIQWIVSYLLVMNLIHHLALFLIEASSYSLIFQSLGKAILSAIYTTLLSLLLLRLFNPSERANA
jgi:hypothetical protein